MCSTVALDAAVATHIPTSPSPSRRRPTARSRVRPRRAAASSMSRSIRRAWAPSARWVDRSLPSHVRPSSLPSQTFASPPRLTPAAWSPPVQGFTEPLTATVVDASCVGVELEVVINGINGVVMGAQGTGYSSAPTATLVGGGGHASFTAAQLYTSDDTSSPGSYSTNFRTSCDILAGSVRQEHATRARIERAPSVTPPPSVRRAPSFLLAIRLKVCPLPIACRGPRKRLAPHARAGSRAAHGTRPR